MKQYELMRFLAPLAGEDCDWHTRHCTLLAVLDELPVGISIKDAATLRYVFRNRVNAEILGLSHADSVGRSSRELFPSEVAELFESSDNEALARGRLALPELRVPGPGGAERFIHSNKTVLHDATGAPRLIVCVFEDITEHKRMKETLLAANAELEQRVRARSEELERAGRINQLGELAAGLAQEINQPLAAIIYTLAGAANRARDGALNNAQMLEALQAAIAHAHRSADILARIRDLANRHVPRRLPLRLNELAFEVIGLCAGSARACGVRLRLELAPALPEIEADRVQIEQVLLNLVRNGIDAVVEEDGRWREVVITTALAERDTVELSVEDSGTGRAPEELRRLFEPFYTTKPEGMGLGLAICQRIIEDHGGRLWAMNRAEGGLCLRFTLPVHQAEA